MTSSKPVQTIKESKIKHETNLGGLAHFLPDDLPLVVLVVFDGLHQSSALFR